MFVRCGRSAGRKLRAGHLRFGQRQRQQRTALGRALEVLIDAWLASRTQWGRNTLVLLELGAEGEHYVHDVGLSLSVSLSYK